MKLTRGNIAALLLGVALAFPTFFGASWAKDQVVSGYPTWSEGDELWARKSGTTNTKQDLTSTGGALDVNIASGSTTPPTGASATQVQGTAAHDAPDSGNPVKIGGRARTSAITSVAHDDRVDWVFSVQGVPALVTGASPADDVVRASSMGLLTGHSGSVDKYLGVLPFLYDGTNQDQQRTVGVGSNYAGTGIAASGTYGQYLNNANQPANTTGNFGIAQVDPAGNLRTAPQRPTASDILGASVSVTSTTASTALITVSAGRTWVGTACASVHGTKAAAATGNGEVLGSFLTAGTSVTPAAGTYFEVDTGIGANAATGVVGTQGSNQGCTPFTLVAPAGNTVTLNYAATCTNTTACRASFSANGVMQ